MIRRFVCVISAALVVAVTASTEPAAAQGFFESLFGRGTRRPAPPPQTSSFADPHDATGRDGRRGYGSDGGTTSGSSGHGTAFCVRTCDGRYFPLQRNAGASPAELCKSFCPATKTTIYYGSKIDHAVGPGGARYADLDNAFTYRDKLVENCTCNGKDSLGLARVDVSEDESLRSGDIVATNNGLASVRVGRSGSAEFTPIGKSSRDWASRLSAIKVRPAPPAEKIAPVAEEESKPARKNRRAHADR